MNKIAPTLIVALLAAVVGAGITWLVIHKRIPNTDNLDDAFYALIIKEPHAVTSPDKFKNALSSVQNNSSQDINVSYCFELEGEEKPLEYGPQDPEGCAVSQPRMPALTHKIYAVSPWDIVQVASQVKEKISLSAT